VPMQGLAQFDDATLVENGKQGAADGVVIRGGRKVLDVDHDVRKARSGAGAGVGWLDDDCVSGASDAALGKGCDNGRIEAVFDFQHAGGQVFG
jgi:hypothetical protein